MKSMIQGFAILLGVLVFGLPALVHAETQWPAVVEDFTPPASGEHPRLLFRESDLPQLRAFAETPQGQALIKRLRDCLNGSDGKSMPKQYNPVVGPAAEDGTGEFHEHAPLGAYTFSHIVGYGFLYQMTQDPLYAELGKQSFEKALAGYRDRDRRYSFKAPYGALRAGPVLGCTAIGYDLCYDGWDDETREKVCRALANYHESEKSNLEALTKGSMPPFSNHYGMQVGGAALALLAINQDPWVNQARIDELLAVSQQSMIRNLTEGFGDGGFFAEGDGTGSMSSHIVFLTALQAWKTAGGLDFITPRPNAPWTALKYLYLTIARDGEMDFWPKRGGYPHNVWQRGDKSGSGYFALGFGGVAEKHKPAMLWFYDAFLKAHDEANGKPFDTPSPYPHFAVCSYINWPWQMQAVNPAEILPKCYRDSKWGLYVFRNRWQDEHDIVISVLTQDAEGYIESHTDGEVHIAAEGKKETWGQLEGETRQWIAGQDGSGILALQNGTCLAVDFSGASGADAMMLMTGPGRGEGEMVELNGQPLSLRFYGFTQQPPIEKQQGFVTIGDQQIRMEDGVLQLSIFEQQ